MSIKANIKVGAATIQLEASSQVDLVKAAGFWGECPTKCGGCESQNLNFFSRSPGGNLYVGMKCKDCGHEFNFGQNKEGGTLFIKHDQDWQPEYKGGGDSQQQYQDQGDPTRNQAAAGAAMDDDDIPY